MLRIEITFNFVSLLEFTRPLIVIHRDRSRRGPCPKSTRQMFPHLKKKQKLGSQFRHSIVDGGGENGVAGENETSAGERDKLTKGRREMR